MTYEAIRWAQHQKDKTLTNHLFGIEVEDILFCYDSYDINTYAHTIGFILLFCFFSVFAWPATTLFLAAYITLMVIRNKGY